MGSRYHADRINREILKALLALIKLGVNNIAEITNNIKKQDKTLTNELIRRKTRYLKQKGYLSGSAQHGYRLTKPGLERLSKLELGIIKEPSTWDRQWRLMLFDIPESQRQLRNQVRVLVKELSCLQLQQSVWAHPFDCLQQFEQIRLAYGQSGHIIFLQLTSPEIDKLLLSKFIKKYPSTKFIYNK